MEQLRRPRHADDRPRRERRVHRAGPARPPASTPTSSSSTGTGSSTRPSSWQKYVGGIANSGVQVTDCHLPALALVTNSASRAPRPVRGTTPRASPSSPGQGAPPHRPQERAGHPAQERRRPTHRSPASPSIAALTHRARRAEPRRRQVHRLRHRQRLAGQTARSRCGSSSGSRPSRSSGATRSSTWR